MLLHKPLNDALCLRAGVIVEAKRELRLGAIKLQAQEKEDKEGNSASVSHFYSPQPGEEL